MHRKHVLTLFGGVGIVGQATLAVVLAQHFPLGVVLAAALVLLALSTLSLRRRFRDDRASTILGRWAELVLFSYWAACVLALPGLVAVTLLYVAGRFAPRVDLLRMLEVVYCGAAALAGWGIWGCRRWVRVTNIVVEWPELPEAFDGYVIAHLTDLHVGSTDTEVVAARWVALANRQRPDIVFVTGDLVTQGTAFYGKVCEALAGLRAPDGVCVVLGNHDLDAPEVLRAELGERGIELLRNSRRSITRGAAELVVVGLDPTRVDDAVIEKVLHGAHRPTFTIMLSHYPHAFEAAAERGVQLVLSGHTHGGQVGVPWFADHINLARLSGQRGRGLVEHLGAKLFVSAGLGTTGLPIRLGVRPEIALLELRTKRQSARL
jgi:hypothetical protein